VTDSKPRDWSRYWQNPFITTFGQVFPANYDGSFLEFWQRELKGPLREVVDVGCGNGALSWIADELLNRPTGRVRITGIDAAAIDPFAALGRSAAATPQLRFIGNTPIERMPFADASIDFVISQFGLEYADIDASVAEIARVLRPGGRLACVMHHAESTIIGNAASQLQDIDAVLQLAIHEHAAALCDLERALPQAEARLQSPEYRSLAGLLAQLTDQVRAIVRDYPAASPIHLYMEQITAAFGPAARPAGPERRAAIVAAGEQLSAQSRRLRHMQAAAVDAAGRERIVAEVRAAGFTAIDVAELGYGDEPRVALTLLAQRR
jgi:ubiquinone/menaquinone biosynthesis C-methylase UbiE